MIEIGKYHTLTILRDTEPGLFLGDDKDNEVLLPNRYVPEAFEIGDNIKVFVYLDNEERPVATTDSPYIAAGDFALLRCNEVTKFGAFLDWGLVKQLFCPFKEQAFKMRTGQWYLVHCYVDDETNRLVASSKTNRFLSNKDLTVEQFDEVDVIISHPSDIGMNVIVNKVHAGLIFNNNIFQDISIGDQLKGVVKKIRHNNKLDITLGQIGYRSIEPNAQKVLDELNDNSGFLAFTDKSDPDEIKDVFQMSKKSFKKAIGSLYKSRAIDIKSDGIYLKE
ncbi:S1-like domain-containing RNA-binding protein [Ichthyenterobacterium sp. W332]|uniref:S1-like domain-containing RNA-binding protein n=1 Tax=Microcosmobacter mediterraneus TaxID=3075607 RepID=A0ABU2YMN5_9FLAO|nr:S1-like domain-containing RNA-binding protein [Ichthyenterobacterium sp. W332]MDT0559419.1 S1-like domain-containing RNA-binding protein [Ichthyenterobacterium sp. W332]